MAGRPRAFDRRAALETAVELFWRYEYDGTTISALTKALGITPPSLYAAFGDKDQLFLEAVSRYSQRIDEGVDAVFDRTSAHEGVVELLHATAITHTAPDRPSGCLLLSEPRLIRERERLRRRIAAHLRHKMEGRGPVSWLRARSACGLPRRRRACPLGLGTAGA